MLLDRGSKGKERDDANVTVMELRDETSGLGITVVCPRRKHQ